MEYIIPHLMQLFFRSYGSGHPFIILHGLLGSSDNWHTLAKTFGGSFHVFTPDARNHGLSPHSDEFDYRVMAEDVREFMDRQRLASAFLLGHSMGGKTAMRVALTYPELVDRLVVVDIAPRSYANMHDDVFDALSAVDLETLTDRKEVDDLLARKVAEPAVRQFLMKNLARDDDGRFRWKMDLDSIRRNYPAITAAIESDRPFGKPTLFIRGAESHYITQSDGPMMKRLFPRLTVATIPGSGHWVHSEFPEEFSYAVLEFLRR